MEHVKEYVELSKKVGELEDNVLKDIVFYLIRNHIRPDMCTLREMEREIGIPYSPLRRLMQRLVDEGVVVEGAVGNVKPYTVLDVDLAIRKGYAGEKLSLEEAIQLHYSALPGNLSVQGVVVSDEIYKSLPHSPLGIDDWERVHGLLEDLRCRPDLPGEVDTLERHGKDWPVEEIEHRRKILERAKKELPPEEWKRLEEKYAKLKEWGSFAPSTSGMAALYMPFMRSNMVMPPFENVPEHLVGEYMRDTGLPKDALKPLRNLPYVDPWTLYYRDLMFELDFPDLSKHSDDQIKEGLRTVAEKNLKFLLHHIRHLLESLESKGVQGTLEDWNRELEEGKKYRHHHILSEAIPIGFSSLFVFTVDGDKKLAEEGRKIAKIIEVAAAYDYKGRKAEGCTLTEFAEKKGSPSGIG